MKKAKVELDKKLERTTNKYEETRDVIKDLVEDNFLITKTCLEALFFCPTKKVSVFSENKINFWKYLFHLTKSSIITPYKYNGCLIDRHIDIRAKQKFRHINFKKKHKITNCNYEVHVVQATQSMLYLKGKGYLYFIGVILYNQFTFLIVE